MMLWVQIEEPGGKVITKEFCKLEELDKKINNVGDLLVIKTADGFCYIVHSSRIMIYGQENA